MRHDVPGAPAEGVPATLRGPRPGLCATAALAAACLLAGGLEGQGRTRGTVDQGRFELRSGGERTGTESFEIRRTGQDVKAVGQVSAAGEDAPGGRRTWLQTDADFRPELFRLRPGGGDGRRVTAVREEERLRLQISSPEGDRWKEFLAPAELTLVEPGVAHQWALILRQHRSALESAGRVEVPAVVPSEARRASLAILRVGSERIPMPGADRSGLRYTATLDGRDEIRIWTGEDGRLLRVEIPGQDWSAVRLPEAG